MKCLDLNITNKMYSFDCKFVSFWIENDSLKGFRYKIKNEGFSG